MQTKQTSPLTTLTCYHLSPHPNQQLHKTITTMPPPRLFPALLRARLQANHQCLKRITPLRRASTTPPSPDNVKPVVPWKTPTSVWSPENLIPPPREGEILLERRPNRELPPIPPLISPQVVKTLPLFLLAISFSLFAFFNYQKQESSVVTSTLYALRTNPSVRAELGDEIYFASKYPWVKGEINQLHGRIDISFWVKGTKKAGEVKLRCRRRGRGGLYYTQEYSLTLEDGRRMELYDPQGNAIDPFQQVAVEEE
ncbi:cytochrome oxidase complex assembly [Pyrenophora seminiperda CCB06]|uniref:Cytochrome oxidase complex assembly n=1 Tax=Pyrenophora seminiperda CCB06 TaxID=1302712 RepID=A0A3M7LUZ9_9PLEO|nr:cytochrome oxidase complex assembly [Pyrenophora seminiperda CCB06]